MLIAAIAVLMAVIVLLDAVEDVAEVETVQAAPTLPQVTVEHLSVGTHTPRVEAFAAVQPRWGADLNAEIGGLVVKVHDQALAGNQVSQGDPLVEIEDSLYQAELAESRQLYHEAMLAAEQAEYATQVARRQFALAGKKPPNDLALKLPQLEIAKAAVKTAEARLKIAQRRLRHTVIRAPYSGYVVRRHVSPGEAVMAGDPVVYLIGDRDRDIAVRLSRGQWELLAHPLMGQAVELLGDDGQRVGSAVVRQAGGYLDEATRQHVVHLSEVAFDDSAYEVLAGQLIKVRFQGRDIGNVISIPASAVTADGAFWWVEQDGTLAKGPAGVIARLDDRVLVQVAESLTLWQVVALPMASYLPGQQVQVRVREAL